MYDRILFPTDGSSTARSAVDHVRNQAERHDAAVHVLHVVDMEHAGVGLAGDLDLSGGRGMVGTPGGSGRGMVGTREGGEETEATVAAEGRDVVAAAAEQFDGIETHTAVRIGFPRETIAEYAADAGIDMIVMGTHGRSGLVRYLLGSVTEHVVRAVDIPVLTVQVPTPQWAAPLP